MTETRCAATANDAPNRYDGKTESARDKARPPTLERRGPLPTDHLDKTERNASYGSRA